MSDQPEALFLADVIENDPQSKAHHDAAAAELRRLHALAMDQQGEIYGLNFARETERKIHNLVKAECDALRADAERLDWIEAQWRDGVHIECCAHGDGTTWHALKPANTVYVATTVCTEDTLRTAIDAAREAK